MKIKILSGKGILNELDKKEIEQSLNKKLLKIGEKRKVIYKKTFLEIERFNKEFGVFKAVDGGSSYITKAYFEII